MIRQQRLQLFRVAHIQIRRRLEQMCQPGERIQPVLQRGPDHTEHHRASTGAAGGVGKQKVFAVDNKGLNAALNPVIADLEPPIQ